MDPTQTHAAPRGDLPPISDPPLALPQLITRRDVAREQQDFRNATRSGTSTLHAWGFGQGETESFSLKLPSCLREQPLWELLHPGMLTAIKAEPCSQPLYTASKQV